MAESLLGTDGVDDLGLGVEFHPEATQVHVGSRLAQFGDATAGRIAVVAGVQHCLGSLLGSQIRRRQVGITEPEIDHVLAIAARLDLQRVDDGKDVRRQRIDAAELHGAKVPAR